MGEALGEVVADHAARYGVSKATVYEAVKGTRRKLVPKAEEHRTAGELARVLRVPLGRAYELAGITAAIYRRAA